MSTLSLEDVEYVAALAKLRLDEGAKAKLLDEMREILGYVEKLSALDTEHVEPMMHAIPMTNVFRQDETSPSLDRDTVLAAAPDHDGEYFLVPKILDAEA